MYAVTRNSQNEISEPNVFNTLAEAKENARSIIAEERDMPEDETLYTYKSWENISRVTKKMLKHAGSYGIVIGVFVTDSEHDLGQALTITLID